MNAIQIDRCDHNHESGSIRARLCARRSTVKLTQAQYQQCVAIWNQGRDAYHYYDGSIDDGRTINRTHALLSIATKGFPVIVPIHGLFEIQQ